MSNNMQSGAGTPDKAQPGQHLWTARDVAHYARCSLRQVSYLRREGLPFVHIGRLVRFDPAQVVGWLLSQDQPTPRSKEVRP
jgi:phage terminase Nu1 subunit (DNA packaging protein)